MEWATALQRSVWIQLQIKIDEVVGFKPSKLDSRLV